MSKLTLMLLSVAAFVSSTITGCQEGHRAKVNPDELIAEVDGRYFKSLAELETVISSRGYDFKVSEPEKTVLLPAIRSQRHSRSEVEEGYYMVLEQTENRAKVYRLVIYRTPQGFYVQDDTGVKNPY